MAKKIVDETLKFNIVVNGNEAQKEYGKLNRSNKKLIDQTKDLEAQADKLRKANKQNTDEYKKLTATIEANNKTVKEQEKRMSQLTEEIGINNLTQRQLGKEARRLRGILSNLTPNTEKWHEYTKQLKTVTARQANLREEMRATEMTMEDQEKVLGQLTIGFGQLFTGIKSGNYQDASEGLRTITGGLKDARKAALAFIATPIGLIITALAGIGYVAKQWFDYNDSQRESIILTEQITKTTGEQADAIRLRNNALKETFGTDEKETLEAAKVLVNEFGITYIEALDEIKDNLIEGADKNNEYLDSIKEYSTFFASAGFSVKEFNDIIAAGFDLGIYTDKLPDALKEFDLSIREQTTATREALINAYGQTFTDDLLARVKSGETTTKQALQEIASESERLGLNIQQNQQLTADVFRGAGEDAGGAIKIFEAVNKAAEDANRALTPLEQSTRELAQSNLELARAQDEALKSDNFISFTRDMKLFWNEVKTQFFNGISYITNIWTRSQDFLISNFIATVTTAKNIPEILKDGLKKVVVNVIEVIKTFGGLGDVLNNLASFKFEAAIDSAKQFKNNFKSAFSEVKTSAKDTVTNIIDLQRQTQKLVKDDILKRRSGNVASENASNTEGNISLNPDNGNSIGEDTQKEIDKTLRKKQAVQDAIDKFNEEQAIRDQLKQVEKDQRAEEEEILRKELEFEKLMADAEGETDLLKQLEEVKENELQAIRDRYAEERAKKQVEQEKEILKAQKKFRDESVKAEENLQRAKANARQFGLNALRSIFGEETKLGKLIFAFQKALAIQEIIQSTAAANAKVSASLATANAIATASSPLTFGQPWVSVNTANAAKNIAANKINAALQIGTIVGTAIKGFEDGLYPITRKQDGKRYNAGVNSSQTQIANQPTILVGERPELIVDPDTFRKMDPSITDYILQLAGKRPLQGFEKGAFPTDSNADSNGSFSDSNAILSTMQMIMGTITRLSNQLDEGIEAKMNYGLHNVREHDKLKEKLDQTITASKN